MDLIDLAGSGHQINITISLYDLLEANKRLLAQGREQGRREAYRDMERERDEELIPKEALAKRLHVSGWTLWDWEQKGLLLPVRVGRKVMYRPSDVDRFIEQKKQPFNQTFNKTCHSK